ncbi:MAG: pentapeptide repeat-containing protein [Sphaerochaeta sp.]|jgi:uncharacterized protein YjbI with pentapeptide repeats|nr:pentapeptide repeat-containing protein [Sphaerochaeta sp.]MDX9914342.1 pentapeptide repeat-containing protein [Sphaerochaeta sp.]
MFALRTCTVAGCHHYAHADDEHCYYHSSQQDAIFAHTIQLLNGSDTVVDLSVSEAHLCNLTIAPKRMAGNNLAWCTFTDVDFSSLVMVNCFFDFCLFERCTFTAVDVRYCVFAGSRFIDCDLSGSLFIHSNFSGIVANKTNFSECDFYYSTFNTALLTDSPFEDCNLKKTDFRHSRRRNVSLRYSNWQEAHR